MDRRGKRKRQTQTVTTSVKILNNIRVGKFTAEKICLEEACINNVVLRVTMQGLARLQEKKKRKGNLNRTKKPPLQPPPKIENGLKKRVLRRPPNGLIQRITQGEKRYYLQLRPFKSNLSKITMDFQELFQRVCAVKLPSKSWRLTVLMDTDLTTVFTFVNCEPLRSVTFSDTNPYFKISMEGLPVVLLGCPKSVSSIKDIEILLEIVNSLSLRDCMVAML